MSIDGRKPTLLRASCRFNRARSFRLGRLAQPRAHSLTARARVRQAQPSLEARSNKPASTQVLAAVVVRLRAGCGGEGFGPAALLVRRSSNLAVCPPTPCGGWFLTPARETSADERHPIPISPSLQPCIDAARDELDASIAKLDTLFSVIEDLGNERFQHLDVLRMRPTCGCVRTWCETSKQLGGGWRRCGRGNRLQARCIT